MTFDRPGNHFIPDDIKGAPCRTKSHYPLHSSKSCTSELLLSYPHCAFFLQVGSVLTVMVDSILIIQSSHFGEPCTVSNRKGSRDRYVNSCLLTSDRIDLDRRSLPIWRFRRHLPRHADTSVMRSMKTQEYHQT